jgi:hypothetical protein
MINEMEIFERVFDKLMECNLLVKYVENLNLKLQFEYEDFKGYYVRKK